MEKKYVIFKLNEDSFSIELTIAREIINVTSIKPVPSMPDFIAGVVHLRGFMLPLIDLKKIIGLPEGEYKKQKKKVIIVSCQKKIFGILIDEIEDIVSIDDEKLIATPALITSMEKNFFKGGFCLNENIILIIDLELILKQHIKHIPKELRIDNNL
jgi:purine-binding chemotaxis protein CheW